MPIHKLTYQKVLEVKERIARGEKQAHIARFFDVSQATVSQIKNNHVWAEVDELDVSEHPNYWSLQSPRFVEAIKQLYLDGYSQYQITPIIQQMIERLDFDIRPSAVHCQQPQIHQALQKAKVKARRSTKPVPDEIRVNIVKLYNQGASYVSLAKQFSLHVNTVYRLIKRTKLAENTPAPLDA